MNVLTRALCAFALALAAPQLATSQGHAVGNWHGVLATPSGSLTVSVQIRQDRDGLLAGDLESADAPNQKILLGALSTSGTALAFSVPSLGATYAATWNDSTATWGGIFRQGMALPLVLHAGAAPAPHVAAGMNGTWRGVLQRDTVRLRVVLHVQTTVARGTEATLDSPDLSAFGLPVQHVVRTGNDVRFSVAAAQVIFVGTVDDTRRTLRGAWTRAGLAPVQVNLTRDAAMTGANVRTQWPISPKGYHAEDVSFVNSAGHPAKLGATLTLPDGAGPFPAVVLLSGSGPEDRDETLFGHKPFAVLADHLSRRGIAVLRFDDRGVGASTGDFWRATPADFARDANAAVQYLQGRHEIEGRSIGLVGHSEGGAVAPIAAVANSRVAFLVLLAAPGTSPEQLLLAQRRLGGMGPETVGAQWLRMEPVMRDIIRAVGAARDSAHAVDGIRTVLTADALASLGALPTQREEIASQFPVTWMRYFLPLRPAAKLARVRVPVLALNGSLDHQVPSAENLSAIKQALASNRDATVRELPGLNHLFQTATTGAMGEYAGLSETFAPGAMDLIAEWILARSHRM